MSPPSPSPRPPLSVPRPRPGGSVAPPAKEAGPKPAAAAPGLGTFSGLGAKAKTPDPSRLAPTVPPQRGAKAAGPPLAPTAPAASMSIPKAPALPTSLGLGPSAGGVAKPGAPALSTVGESTGNESISLFVANTGVAPAPGALMPSRSVPTAPAVAPRSPSSATAISTPAQPAVAPKPPAAAPPRPPMPSAPGLAKPDFRSATLLGLPSPIGLGGPGSPPPGAAPRPAPPSPVGATPSPAGSATATPSPTPTPASAAAKAALDAVPTQLGGFDATRAPQAPRPSQAPAETASAAPKRAPYVNIHLDRPAPEDLTPTIPRDAAAYIEAHGGTLPSAGPAPATVASSADDDPDAGWDDPPEVAASPLVPLVPVVLAGSSPALPASPAIADDAAVSAVARGNHQPYASGPDEIEDLSSRHLLSEVDDALPTPAINGLPEGTLDPVPLARAVAEATGNARRASGEWTAAGAPKRSTPPPVPTAPRHIGVVPPPPLPPSSASIKAASPPPQPPQQVAPQQAPQQAPPQPPRPASPSTAPTGAAAPSAPPPADTGTGTGTPADIPVLPLVSAPSAAQKTQKIIRPPNAPRLVPEVMTPALLSAGPYRGEVHLEASASAPSLPAPPVGTFDSVAPPPMLRDAQPTVMAQHRLAEAAAAARRQVENSRLGTAAGGGAAMRPPVVVAAAIAVGAFVACFAVGAFAITSTTSPGPTALRASLPLSRAMFEARRGLEDATPRPAPAAPVPAPPPTTAAAAMPPGAAPSLAAVAAPADPTTKTSAHLAATPGDASRGTRRAPTAAKVVAHGAADGF